MERFIEGEKEKEQRLLEILRSSNDAGEMKRTCFSLAGCGTIYSFPVLAARMADTTKETEEILQYTAGMIGRKINIPKEVWSALSDPNHWKPSWNGPPESFLAFVEMFSMAMANGQETGKITDRLGEIFMKIIEVDLSPYQDFHALRICSTGDHLQKFAERITNHLQSQVMVNDLLGDVSIDLVRTDIDEEVYKSLQMDYFTTRMRQYVKFSDE